MYESRKGFLHEKKEIERKPKLKREDSVGLL